MKAKAITTRAEAQQAAIDWQGWQSKRKMAYSEVSEWQAYFIKLAKRFNLTAEFKENGII
jgi:hypothetical protein